MPLNLSALLAGFLSVFGLLLGVLEVGGQTRRGLTGIPCKLSVRFQLHVEVASNPVKVGSPIIAVLSLKNVSPRIVDFMEAWEFWDYEVQVTGREGREVPRTAFGRHLLEDERGGSRKTRELQPGEVKKLTLDISRVYDLRTPGKYVARVCRGVPPERGDTCERVFSNATAFEVIE